MIFKAAEYKARQMPSRAETNNDTLRAPSCTPKHAAQRKKEIEKNIYEKNNHEQRLYP